MKYLNLALILCTLLVNQAYGSEINTEYAKSLTLDRQYTKIYAVEAKLVDTGMVFPKCPPRAACEPMGTVTLKFTLGGCLDELGPVTVRLESVEDKYYLHVNAFAFTHEDSSRVRCVAPNMQVVTLPIGKMGGLEKSQIKEVFSSLGFLIKK